MTTKEALIKTRELIAAGWCQWSYAKDKDGLAVNFDDPEACKYCLTGALNSVTPSLSTQRSVRDLLYTEAGEDSLAYWNDTEGRTQQDVLDLLDKVISKEA